MMKSGIMRKIFRNQEKPRKENVDAGTDGGHEVGKEVEHPKSKVERTKEPRKKVMSLHRN